MDISDVHGLFTDRFVVWLSTTFSTYTIIPLIPKKKDIHLDLKIGAIDLDMNKLSIFNSPELQLGESILPLILGL